MRVLARAACVVAVVAVATLGEGGASASSLLAQHLLLAAAVAACVLVCPAAGFVPSRGPTAAWLTFALLAAAGAVVAPYAYAAWLVLVEIAAFGAVVWLASGEPAPLARVFPPAVALLAASHGVVAVAERVSGSQRPASTFLNPNHLGAWLAAAVLLLAGRQLDRSLSLRARIAYGGSTALALAGIFVTGSRGAALGVALGAIALVGMTWSALSAPARRVMLAGVAVAVLATAVGVAARFRSDDDPYRFHRTRIWRASLRAVAESPWRGTGPGQFAAAAANLNFPLEDTPLRYGRLFRTPHSDALRAFCEFGLPAGLAAFGALALFSREIRRGRSALTPVTRGAFGALVGLAAQACVDDLSTRPAITMLGAALVGLLLAVPRERPAGRGAAIAVTVLLVAGVGVGEVAGFVGWKLSYALPRGPLEPSQLSRLRRAIAWNPMQPDLWERLAEHAERGGAGSAWSLADYAVAREAAEHATRLQPADAFYARGAARVAAAASLSILPFTAERDRAARLYDEAQLLARTDAAIPLEKARFLLQAGDPSGARRAAEQALKIEPRAGAAWLCLAQAVSAQDGPAGSPRVRQLLDEAEAVAPRPGEIPASAYDASLRAVDPELVASLRAALDGAADR
jgi:tetratricopeptide (TPR) repeat protein